MRAGSCSRPTSCRHYRAAEVGPVIATFLRSLEATASGVIPPVRRAGAGIGEGGEATLRRFRPGRRPANRWSEMVIRDTPRVGELRPFRPVCSNQRSLGSQEPALVGLRPEGSLPSDSTDCPAKGPTSLPPAELPRFGGRCATPMTATARSSATSTPKPTAYLRARRQTNSPHGLNRPPERPSAEHATPANCYFPDLQEPQ